LGALERDFICTTDVYHTHGFVTQVHGRKEITLFSPVDDEYMYPDKKRRNWSQIDNIDQPNLNVFPNFQLAKPYRAVVYPGETIFQPSGWWHTTRLLEPCIGIVKSTVDRDLWNRFVNEYYEDFITTNPINTRLKMGLLKFMSFTKVI